MAGWLSDTLRTRKRVIVAGFLLLAPMLALAFQLPRAMIVPAMLLLGLCASAIPTVFFAAAPETVEDPQSVAMSLVLVTAGMNLRMVIGPPLFAAWRTTGVGLLPDMPFSALPCWAPWSLD